jgi:cytochrome P450
MTALPIVVLVIIVCVSVVYVNYYNIRINIINFLIINRGLLAPNCFWWRVSTLLLEDANGINLYQELKARYGKQTSVNVMGTTTVLIMDLGYIKQILDNSPNTFCVGKLKYNFFKPFMRDNVGVSKGCPWARRRRLNEAVLGTDVLHAHADTHNQMIGAVIRDRVPSNFDEFLEAAKKIVSRIVFNKPRIPDEIFEIFSVANSLDAVVNSNFELPPQLNRTYREFIWSELQNPEPLSLVSLTAATDLRKEELIDQVPHWMFPIGGIVHTVSARTLALLCNHRSIFSKLLEHLREVDITSAADIDSAWYLRCCILECLRLNNLVTSTFRTACTDVSFEDGTRFEKGTQFLILNNPILREPECFESPNEFIPERWSAGLERSYCALLFNQGPQRCPGKDLSLFIIQSVVVHYLAHSGVLYGNAVLHSIPLDVKNIPQMIDPCSIVFTTEIEGGSPLTRGGL